ncbi:DUF4158 domain-containing protein [Streptosporangium sp. NBC_01810]|uniref:DUF4158 domain-containing protein n=1 Tax=Streptosporangium sp. NBC_01810 TaxID=2975951 RepID=UPI002DD8BDDB|nr:DUF4158 domain-containing protein [Streptosporangium sp. NBC_01810]WSA23447.1 DUF4158 domain-containing protein [Streptosporangium sp. NBC_01810]
MPVEFLSDEQAEAYGTFAEEPTRPELERFFFLDDVDRDLIALPRTKHHQRGAIAEVLRVQARHHLAQRRQMGRVASDTTC